MDTRQENGTNSFRWGLWLSILTILLMSLLALFAPAISPYDPRQMSIGLSNYPPVWYDTPPKAGLPEYLLGTDLFGRDILSHVIHGARAAMFLTLIAIPLAVLFGVVMGVIAGMGNKLIEAIFLRITDIVNSVPSFMFAV